MRDLKENFLEALDVGFELPTPDDPVGSILMLCYRDEAHGTLVVS
jgi:hypothetical protein